MIIVNWYALNGKYNDTIMKPLWPDQCNWQLSLSTVSSSLSGDLSYDLSCGLSCDLSNVF